MINYDSMTGQTTVNEIQENATPVYECEDNLRHGNIMLTGDNVREYQGINNVYHSPTLFKNSNKIELNNVSQTKL